MLWGTQAAGALDAERAACSLIGKGAAIVVLGPEGEILFTGGDPEKGQYIEPDAEKTPAMWADLKRAVEPHLKKGLLGDLDMPDAVKPITQALKAGQLAAVQNMLTSIQDSNAQLGPFKKELAKRLEDLRAKKRALFDSLDSAGKKWDAYRVGTSYQACFPKASDGSEVRTKVSALGQDATVRKNLEAQKLLTQILTIGYGPAGAKDRAPAKAALLDLAKKFAETEFAPIATNLANFVPPPPPK